MRYNLRTVSSSASVPARAHADTQALFNELQRRFARSQLAKPDAASRLASRLLAEALRSRTLPPLLHDALASCARDLIAAEADLFQLPPLPSEHSVVDGLATRTDLRHRLEFMHNEKTLVAEWTDTLVRLLSLIIDATPAVDPTPASLVVPVPILSLVDDATNIIHQIVACLVPFAPDPRSISVRPGALLAARIIANLLAVSRCDFEAAQRHPERLRWPGADRATPAELVARFLADTPFAALLDATLPLPVGHRPRFEGTHILARPGHGKTQLLQTMFLADADDPARPSLVFIDSQADAINTLARLQRFDPDHDDRLIILNPADTEWPLKFNMFAIDRDRIDKLDLGAREEIYEGVIEIWSYVFGGLLGSELTSRQSMTFRFLGQLLLAIPDSTIHTLVALLKDPAPFLGYVERLQPTAREFLSDHLFSDRRGNEYIQVRSQLLRRLWHVLSSPVFERMFSHPHNGVSFKAALDTGKVLLINTAKSRLKAEWSQIFGRFCVAQILQATLERAADPPAHRRPAFIYIDECHEYLDQTTELFLLQARKYMVGMVLAHQNIEGQLKNPGLKAALSTTAIRFAGQVSAADAAKLAPDMRCSPDFLLALRKHERHTEFAVHVRGLTPSAVKLSVPFLTAENEPKMSDTAYEKLLTRIRAQVAAPLTARPTHPLTAPDPQPTDPDDFGEKY